MDQHAAELFRAGEKMREWFVDHWQDIAKLLEVAGDVNLANLDEKDFIARMEEAVLNLKVVDPQPRLVELDRQLNKWRGVTMQAVADVVKPRPQANLEDPGQLLGQMVLLNARITRTLGMMIVDNQAKPSEIDELRGMIDRLGELSKEGAPWQD